MSYESDFRQSEAALEAEDRSDYLRMHDLQGFTCHRRAPVEYTVRRGTEGEIILSGTAESFGDLRFEMEYKHPLLKTYQMDSNGIDQLYFRADSRGEILYMLDWHYSDGKL